MTYTIFGDGNTIALMEWLRDTECPELESDHFYNKYGRYAFTVSSVHEGEEYYDEYREKLLSEDAFEYEGMRRYHDCCIWLFMVNDKIYYATT